MNITVTELSELLNKHAGPEFKQAQTINPANVARCLSGSCNDIEPVGQHVERPRSL